MLTDVAIKFDLDNIYNYPPEASDPICTFMAWMLEGSEKLYMCVQTKVDSEADHSFILGTLFSFIISALCIYLVGLKWLNFLLI